MAESNVVYVEHCVGCEGHSYHTRHKSELYLRNFDWTSKAILQTCPELTVTANEIFPDVGNKGSESRYSNKNPTGKVRYPRVGAFEVIFRGRKVFSKLEIGMWPNPEFVANKVKRILEGLEPESPQKPSTPVGAFPMNVPKRQSPPRRPLPGSPGHPEKSEESSPGRGKREANKGNRDLFAQKAKPVVVGKTEEPKRPVKDRHTPIQEPVFSLPEPAARPKTPGEFDRRRPADHSPLVEEEKAEPTPPSVHPPVSDHAKPIEDPRPETANEYVDEFEEETRAKTPQTMVQEPPKPVEVKEIEKRVETPPAAHRDEEDLDELFPEQEVTQDIELTLSLGVVSEQGLPYLNQSENTEEISVKSSNPALLKISDPHFSIAPGETRDLLLEFAANDQECAKSCILYISVNGKVKECIKFQVIYSSQPPLDSSSQSSPEKEAHNPEFQRQEESGGESEEKAGDQSVEVPVESQHEEESENPRPEIGETQRPEIDENPPPEAEETSPQTHPIETPEITTPEQHQPKHEEETPLEPESAEEEKLEEKTEEKIENQRQELDEPEDAGKAQNLGEEVAGADEPEEVEMQSYSLSLPLGVKSSKNDEEEELQIEVVSSDPSAMEVKKPEISIPPGGSSKIKLGFPEAAEEGEKVLYLHINVKGELRETIEIKVNYAKPEA